MEKELVFRNESGQSATSSILVAETFDKEHRHVVRDIDNLIENLQSIENQYSPNLGSHQTMFQAYYEDIPMPNGGVKPAKHYFMNKDGFTLLVMGYTGQKALEFKLKYIAAFNAMENELKQLYQKSIEDSQRAISLYNGVTKQLGNINSRMDKVDSRMDNVDNRLIFMEKRSKIMDKRSSVFRKPAKPAYLTVDEARAEFSFAVHNISVEDFYHCLRELEFLEKEGEDFNRPRGQYAASEMLIAVNITPDPEEADTENQDFTLLFTSEFVKIVIETVKFYNAYDLKYYSKVIQKNSSY